MIIFQMFYINLSTDGVCVDLLCFPQDFSQCVTCKEKHITVKKEPHESLGMTVAGGRGSKSGELPIFVTSVQPHGCLSRDGRIKRGKHPLMSPSVGTDFRPDVHISEGALSLR